MKDDDLFADWRRTLQASVAYFSSANKGALEQWVCTQLFTNLDLDFDLNEVVPQIDDPPDVIFRDSCFEVKEVLDPGRRRHDEYKKALSKAQAGVHPAELLQMFAPEDMDSAQLGQLVLEELGKLRSKYEQGFRATLNLVLYVDLLRRILKPGPMPAAEPFAMFGWRSVSVIMGWGALVFSASAAAPDFLQKKVGTVTLRQFA
jgi:hypothetical protein